MDLRSSRSRSNTPTVRISSGKATVLTGNHVGSLMRSTRSTTIKTYESSNVNVVESSSNISKPAKMKSSRSQRSKYKTSDYSSEDGEHEVNSTTYVSDGGRYRGETDVMSTNGGTKVSALEFYKEAGDYWNKYPKTDYTYSRHSKDRVELAPGVVAMPNMSRRSLHSTHSSEDSATSNKETNTESYHEEEDELEYTSLQTANTRLRPRTLFTNNNYQENHYAVSRSNTYVKTTFISKFISTFVNILTIVFYPISYAYNVQHVAFLYFGKKLHKVVSKVMFLDTWLLQGSTSSKVPIILGLCLIPLMLFGGWWLITGLNQLMYGMLYSNGTTSLPPIASLVKTESVTINNHEEIDLDTHVHFDRKIPIVEENIVRVRDNVALQPGTTGEMYTGLSDDQIKSIADAVKNSISLSQFDTDLIIRKVLGSPSIQNVAEKNVASVSKLNDDLLKHKKEYDSQKLIVNSLSDEISKLRTEFVEVISQLRAENANNNVRFLNEINKCCRRSFIQVEGYVTKILGDLLGTPGYVTNQKDLSNWLHSIFVAKKDLELRLANLTHTLKSEYDVLIENNGKRIMDDVASKISIELNKHIAEKEFVGSIGSISDEHIKKIVGDALSVYDADKTGLVDYALEASGGQIISTRCTESYQSKTAVVSLFGIPLWYPSNTPRVVITPGVNPGECWAFQNFPGFLVVRLSAFVKIEAFTMEHVSQKLVPNGQISSAPRQFEVYGLRNETDREPTLLGKYVYNHDGKPLQYFPAEKTGIIAFNLVELRILSNHGNPNYTCLYRFRVHGTLSNEPT